MSEIRNRSLSFKAPSQVDKANHMNRMQSRSCMNQIEVLEHDIRKKLKVIENEKIQVARYLRFLRSSSGASGFSMAPQGRHDRPRLRPATAGSRRFKFGVDGNANHSYMCSDPTVGWAGYDDGSEAVQNNRARSACMSRPRLIEFQSTLSRMRKIEEPLKKRVSWIDGGDGGDDGIRGYSSGIRIYSQNLKNSNNHDSKQERKASTGTQYEEFSITKRPVEGDDPSDVDSVQSSVVSRGGSRRPTAQRAVKSIQPINVTFPFPVTPDRFLRTESDGEPLMAATSKRRESVSSVITTFEDRRPRKRFA